MVNRYNLLSDETRLHVSSSHYRLVFQIYRWLCTINTLERTFVTDTIKKAIKRHGAPEIMNSDQGSQFTCEDYINLLKENNIKISMDGKGRALTISA